MSRACNTLTPPLQPWFRSVSGSPRSTFSDCPLEEEGENLAPKLTPLLLDSSSNSYVDTWLQVDDGGDIDDDDGGGGGYSGASGCQQAAERLIFSTVGPTSSIVNQLSSRAPATARPGDWQR